MSKPQHFFFGLAILFLVICLSVPVVDATSSFGYNVEASLDYESFVSVTYLRIVIQNQVKLPVIASQDSMILFNLQLPSAFSNIEDNAAICSRNATSTSTTPFLTLTQLSSESQGFEVTYPTVRDSDNSDVYCVIKIRESPTYPSTYTSSSFLVQLLSARAVLSTPSGTSYSNKLSLSFTIPALFTSTSSRVFPDDTDFLYSTETYTTSLNIDSALLSLRENNRLVLVHPWNFVVDTTNSFCSSPHSISQYDYDMQIPITTANTSTSAVAIALSDYASSLTESISCQIALILDNVAEQDSGEIAMYLEYQYYNQTGTTINSQMFETFTSRLFVSISSADVFPSYVSSTMLNTPAIATTPNVSISPIFLKVGAVHDQFWNLFSIQLTDFEFGSDQYLYFSFPNELDANNTCVAALFAGTYTPVQFDNCMQELTAQNCPDFEGHIVIDTARFQGSHKAYGLIIKPSSQLRFASVTCSFNFAWGLNDLSDIYDTPTVLNSSGYSIQTVLISSDDVTALTSTSLQTVSSTDFSNTTLYSSFDVLLDAYYAPEVSLSLWQYSSSDPRHAANFATPLVGGTINITIYATEDEPLVNGFLLEVMGLRMIQSNTAWISGVYINNTDYTANYTASNATRRFSTSIETLANPASSDATTTYLYPVITFTSDSQRGLTQTVVLAFTIGAMAVPLDTTYQTDIATISLWHYESELASYKLPTAFTIASNPVVYWFLTKTVDQVETYFVDQQTTVLTALRTADASTQSIEEDSYVDQKMAIQGQLSRYDDEDQYYYATDVLAAESASTVAASGTTASSDDQWFILQDGLIGIWLDHFYAVQGDVLNFSGTSAEFMTNVTSISNIVTCVGSVSHPYGDWATQNYTWITDVDNVEIMVISVTGNQVSGTFSRNITTDQYISCNATIVPRYPNAATAVANLPTVAFRSGVFPNTNYLGVNYTIPSTVTSSTVYPFTYYGPMDISNLPDTSIALTTTYNSTYFIKQTYAAFQLTVQGMELTNSGSASITLTFPQQNQVAAVTTSSTQSSLLASQISCPGTVTAATSGTSLVVRILTTDSTFVATANDPFVCQFLLQILPNANTVTPTVSFGSDLSVYILDAITFSPLPYTQTITPEADQGKLSISVSRFGYYPMVITNLPVYDSFDKTCVTSAGVVLANVSYSSAIGISMVTLLDTYSEALSEGDILSAGTCTFSLTRSLNADSQNIYLQFGPFVYIGSNTLPAISSMTTSGVISSVSSIQLPWYSEPVLGATVDIYHKSLATGDLIRLLLPSGVAYANASLSPYSSLYSCSSSLELVPEYILANNTWAVNVTATAEISAIDEVVCSFWLNSTNPIPDTTFGYIIQSNINSDSLTSTSNVINVTARPSTYAVSTVYALQWSQANSQLELVLDLTYASSTLSVRSNTLMYDFSGMKSSINNSVSESLSDGIQAGSAIISENLSAASCFVPGTDSFGNIIVARRLSAQYIRETGYKLIIALPARSASSLLNIRCTLPVNTYNQQFTVTPSVSEYPTGYVFVNETTMPAITVSTWFPSSSIVILDDDDSDSSTNSTSSNETTASVASVEQSLFTFENDPDANGVLGSVFSTLAYLFQDVIPPADAAANAARAQASRVQKASTLPRGLEANRHISARRGLRFGATVANMPVQTGSSGSSLSATITGVSSSSAHSSHLLSEYELYESMQMQTSGGSSQFGALSLEQENLVYDSFQTSTTESTDSTSSKSTKTVVSPTSATDQALDIRYLDILFKQTDLFTNDQLDDIINTIWTIAQFKDRTITLSSIIIIAQQRPPIASSSDYILLRVGFAGLNVESTLLESKFAGVDFMHWLSGSYQVLSYSVIDGGNFDYHYGRTRVPAVCLVASGSSSEITTTCGAECGRLCSAQTTNKKLRSCSSDFDCDTLNCDLVTLTCSAIQSEFTNVYTGVYSNYGKSSQQSIYLSKAVTRS